MPPVLALADFETLRRLAKQVLFSILCFGFFLFFLFSSTFSFSTLL